MAEGVDISLSGRNPEEVVKIEALRVRLMELLEGFTLRMKVRKSYGIGACAVAFYEFYCFMQNSARN